MASDEKSLDDPRNGYRDDRKSARTVGPGVHDGVDGMIFVRDFAGARHVLRSGRLRQAGFRAELIERFAGPKNAPVLFQDGEAHQKQRSATARFFAPKVVATRYRALMEELSDRLVERFRSAGNAELDAISLELAVAVAAEIVGLTESEQAGMALRLNKFFDASGPKRGWLSAVAGFAAGQYKMLTFYLRDVRPAIRARRKARREDVISHRPLQSRRGARRFRKRRGRGLLGLAARARGHSRRKRAGLRSRGETSATERARSRAIRGGVPSLAEFTRPLTSCVQFD
jgi:cytochrome P450